MPGAWETLYVRVRGDSDLQKTFAKDEKAAGKFDKTLGGIFKKYSDRKVSLQVEEDGAAKTAAALKGVDKVAGSVDGRSVDINVDKDGSALKGVEGLSSGFKGLAGNIRATGTVLTAASIPFAIAGIGAGTPTILALGSSFAGLALNLGKAAAGFGLVAGAAGGGALVGLKTYTALISSTVSASREAYTALHEQAQKQLELQRQQILNTEASRAFNEEINRQIIGFSHLQAAVGNKVFPMFTTEMKAWGSVLEDNRGEIADTAGVVAGTAAAFSKWFRTAEDGKVLDRTIGFINSSAEKGAGVLSDMAATGVMAFQPLIPLASDLQSEVLGLTRQTEQWVESAEGQKRLSGIYTSLWEDAKRLGPVLLDTGRGLFNIFSAIDKSGLSDQASRGLESIASSFEHVTSEGTKSRDRIDGFLHSSLELMPHVAGAATALWHQIFRVADAAIDAREEGHKLTILQEIFDGIKKSAKPLGNLLVGTFRDLGPEIADLIPNLAKLAENFAGSSGPLTTFVHNLNRMMELFNRLPAPVKSAVANLVALKVILGGLGVGAVVGPLGNLVSNMWAVNRVSQAVGGKTGLPAVAGSLSRIGLVLAGGIGLAAVAGAFYLAYQRSDKFHDAVNGLAADLASWGKDKFADAKAAIADIFDIPTAVVKKAGRKSGDATVSAYEQVLEDRASGYEGNRSAPYEFGQKAGEAARRGFHSVYEGGKGAKETVPDVWWKQALAPPTVAQGSPAWAARQAVHGFADEFTSSQSRKQIAKAMKNPIMAGAKLIPPALMNVWQNITGQADSQFGKTGRKIAENLEKAKEDGSQSQRELDTNTSNTWGRILQASNFKWPKIAEAIITASARAKERGGESQRELEANDKNVWQRILDATPIWGKIASGVVTPTIHAVSDVKQAWSDLLNFLADVVSRLGFKDLAASIRGSVPAGKGSSYGGSAPGGDNPNTKPVEHFARGGIKAQGAVGGVADGSVPHAVYGEVGKAESYAVHGRRDNIPYGEAFANSVGMTMVPKLFASGGILKAWQRAGVAMHALGATLPVSALSPAQQQAASAVHQQFPSTTQNTYVGHPGGAANSFDNWGPGGRGDPIGSVGNQVKPFLIKNFSPYDWLIWNGIYTTPGGSKPYWDPADMHYDHVHFTRGSGAGGFSGGSVSVPNPVQLLYDALWPKVEGMANAFINPLSSSPKILAQAAGRISRKAIDTFGQNLDARIPDTIGSPSGTGSAGLGGSDAVGGSPAANRAMGEKMLAASNLAGSFHSLDLLNQRESGWDRFARNPSSGAYGIPQALPESKLPPSGQSSGGSHAGAQLDWQFGYIGSTYGSTDAAWQHSQNVGWYKNGGVVPGRSGQAVPIMAHAGEVVVPERYARGGISGAPTSGWNLIHGDGALGISGPASNAAMQAAAMWGATGVRFTSGGDVMASWSPGKAAGTTSTSGRMRIDPQFAGMPVAPALWAHEIGHALGLAHNSFGIMRPSVGAGFRPTSSEIDTVRRLYGGQAQMGEGAHGGGASGMGGGGGYGGGSVNRNSIYKRGGGSQTGSTFSSQGASSGRARIEGAVAGWANGGIRARAGNAEANIERGARAGEAQLAETKGLRRDINRLMKVMPADFADTLRGKPGQDLHRHHQAGIREKLAAAGVH